MLWRRDAHVALVKKNSASLLGNILRQSLGVHAFAKVCIS